MHWTKARKFERLSRNIRCHVEHFTLQEMMDKLEADGWSWKIKSHNFAHGRRYEASVWDGAVDPSERPFGSSRGNSTMLLALQKAWAIAFTMAMLYPNETFAGKREVSTEVDSCGMVL
ncbi:hypothetical protein [Deinococcus wulumuqiensis]|uniref:DUF4177 domain-containing protein n=1 Tax=Deinococcus wulumuqiensis TaxID=980427 RepID=A0AAV4K4V8_9DEIO|nr:hypothetical protein [Deinococcus wulumuqiensis]QII20188.1 hypothetical protein G6R31_04955 [Deinococcus wulumuqiensis R12]GGI75342.1 hypothetical protein GCM10010914_06960 [Deinococcus wulumuqiensis]GGP28712.1 hypothetical protein GCM10008021_03630 [Deinococcus wulumuqiensis]